MTFKRFFLFLLFTQAIALKVNSQNANTTTDSLQKEKEDSTLIATQLEILEAKKKTGEKKSISHAYYNTGLLFSEHKNYLTAIEYYMLSLIICRELNDDVGAANCYQSMADAHKNLNHYAEAVRYYSDATETYNALGYKNEMAYCCIVISEIYEIKKNIQQAIKYTRQAKNIYAYTKDSEKLNNCTTRIKYLKAK